MLQLMEAGIGNTSSTAQTAKIFKLPDRTARGAPDGGDRAHEFGPEFVRAAYEAAGGSCVKPVEMRPLGRRLGLEPRAVENLAMRLQAERLVRVVSMANGLLRLTPEGVRAAEGAPRAGGNFAGTRASPVVGRGALRGLEEMLDPLKADLDRLDLDGALDGEQRSELAAEIRTIEAQLGSPRPKRRIVVAALESVKGVVGSVDGAVGGAESETESETESERILRAIDAFLDGAGQTGWAARGVGGAAGEAAGEARVGRAAQGARNGAGLAQPGGDLADDENGPGPRYPEEESAATTRSREAGGVRVRKRVRDDGGQATGQATGRARGAGKPAGEGASEDVGEGADRADRGAGGAAGRAGDAADRPRAREAEAGRRVLRVVDGAGDILQTALNEDGEILDEEVVGNVADPPVEEHADEGGRVAGWTTDGSRPPIRSRLGEDGGGLDPRILPPAGAEKTVEGSGHGSRSGSRPQEAKQQTEDRGAGNLPARFLRQTVDGARAFHGDSLGRIGGRLRGDRAQLEGLAEQVPEGDAEARIRALIDSYSAVERSLDRAARGPGAADAAAQREREDKGGDGRQAVGEAGEGQATGEVGQGAEQAVQRDGEEAGRAAGEAGQGADQAARGAGAAVGQAVEGASEAAGQAAEGAKRITQDVGGAVGQDTKQGSDDEAQEADDVVDQMVGQANGAVQKTTGLAGEVMKGVQDTADQATGTAEDIAPNSQMPGEHTLGEEKQTVRRTVDEPGYIIIQSTLDESGNVLDEKIVERQ